MNTLSPDLLAECLAAVESGEATVEACVAEHPEYAEELEGLLSTALALTAGPAVEPDSQFRLRGRSALLTAIAVEQGEARGHSPWRRFVDGLLGRPETLPVGGPRQAEMPLPVFFTLAVLVGGASAALSLASEESLPGQPLYALKSTTEIVRLNLNPSAEGKAGLHLVFATRRLDEMERMAGLGQTTQFPATAERYSNHLKQAETYIADNPNSKVSVDIAMLRERLSRRDRVLAELRPAVPASAQPALDQAITVTQNMAAAEAPAVALAPAPAPAVTPPPVDTQAPQAATPTPVAVAEAVISLEELKTAVTSLASEGSTEMENQQQELVVQVASARAAVEEGQPEVAADSLTNFAGEIVVMQQSGQISTEEFQELYRSYANAAGKVGATMSARAEERRASPKPAPAPTAEPAQAESESTATAQPAPVPTAVAPTPTPGSGDHKPGGGPAKP